MVNVSFAENASGLKPKEGSTPELASGSASIISLKASFDYIASPKRTYFGSAIVPLFGGDYGVFMGLGGVNFFFNDLSSMFDFSDNGSSISIMPKKRYYWGLSTGLGYLIYSSETAKKSDIAFFLGGQGGIIYNIKPNLDLKADLTIGRLTGISTTSISMQAFFGISYYLH
jgi:hypothetical protein